jgi:hypothetical protein
MSEQQDRIATHAEIRSRMGVVPNFFTLSSEAPLISKNLWEFAKFAYLDSPLPSLFKERLFVHLSRFCEVRYCLARHLGFLVGMGRPAGDPNCPPMTLDAASVLLESRFPDRRGLERHVRFLQGVRGPLVGQIEPDSDLEQAIFALVTRIFLKPSETPACMPALRRLFGPERVEFLLLYVGFIRFAHYWTRVHPELREEEDLAPLIAQLDTLAWRLVSESEGAWTGLGVRASGELRALRVEMKRRGASPGAPGGAR